MMHRIGDTIASIAAVCPFVGYYYINKRIAQAVRESAESRGSCTVGAVRFFGERMGRNEAEI